MKIHSQFATHSRSMEMNLTPMIDVVFLLLIFFLWTSSFEVPEQLLPSSLLSVAGTAAPTASPPETRDLERVVVRLYWQANAPSWTVNDLPAADLAEVSTKLKAVAQVGTAIPVLIDPQDATPLEFVIRTYDEARQAGFSEVQFAAGTPLTPP